MQRPGTALVTGGGGFIGGRLVRALTQAGWEVRLLRGVDAAPAGDPALPEPERVFGFADRLPEVVDGVTHFFNFAVAYDRPANSDVLIAEVNVTRPLRVLDALAERGGEATCLLGDSFFRKFPPGATSQGRYTTSKAVLADAVAARRWPERMRVALLRIEQVYGPGESFAKVLPRVTRQLLENVERIALTDGLQRRDFIHVDDVVAAALVAARAAWSGVHTVPCGTGTATPVRTVFETLHALSGSRSIMGFGDMAPDQAIPESLGDASWLRARGWHPRRALADGLAELVRDVSSRCAP